MIYCQLCKNYTTKKYYRTHVATVHNKNKGGFSFQSFGGILQSNWIYQVSETAKGVQHPVHAQKQTSGEALTMICESNKCELKSAVMSMNGNRSYECPYLMSTQYLKISDVFLDSLVSRRRLSPDSRYYCLRMSREAKAYNQVLVSGMETDIDVSILICMD